MRYWYVIIALLLAGCGKDLLEPEQTDRGLLPLSPFVAIGGSETAGFADGALHLQAQQFSYPALIARQLQTVGGASFAQPLTVDSGGYWFSNGLLYSKLHLENATGCNGTKDLMPVRGISGAGTLESFSSVGQAGPYGNLAIPFVKTGDLNAPDIANTNSYFRRLGSSASTLQQTIINRSPRLFTIWLGMEDILDNAINQGPEVAPIQFFNNLVPLLDSLVEDTTAAGFIATIPDVTAFPFFNTIPYNGLMLDQAQANALNQLYSGIGLSFQAGSNAYVIEDNNAPGGKRLIKPTEKLMLSLPSDSLKCYGLGASEPISARYVLDETELTFVRYQVSNYNIFIRDLATGKGLYVVDLNSFYASLEAGLRINGIEFNNQLIYGAFFSLDGINPSQRGAALIANEFITVMNEQYRAAIPYVSIGTVPGIKFP